jgi:hypothetical protein
MAVPCNDVMEILNVFGDESTGVMCMISSPDVKGCLTEMRDLFCDE